MEQQFLHLMLNFVKEAGDVAMKLIADSRPALKADRSVVTLADQQISDLARHVLGEYLSTSDHLLIDEEDPNHLDYLEKNTINNTPYIWAIDPVDGTRPYSNGMPFFGVSLGLLKERKPWMGVVYFPYWRELFYCDGVEAYWVKNAFGQEEIKQRIVPIDQVITDQSIFLCSDEFFKRYDWVSNDCHVMIPGCAVIDLCWSAIGRCCGGLFRAHLWDLAGSWPIFRCAGLELRSLVTGKVLDHLELEAFQHPRRPWRLREFYVLSSARNFPVLKEKLQLRKE